MWEFKETTNIIAAAEQLAARGMRSAAVEKLRQTSLDQFGFMLWGTPNERWPALSTMLPSAPSKDVQMRWTGNSGDALLSQSFSFVRSLVSAFHKFVGGDLSQQKVLDFGCGYGRHLRLMEYFVDVENLHGCDAWDESLAECRKSGIAATLKQSDAVPERLPYPEQFFSLVYSMSVFTHLSERSAAACLAATRNCIRSDGLLAVTIRPAEYWAITGLPGPEKAKLIETHERDGFAYFPYGGGDYGDTSVSLTKLAEMASGWRVVGTDWNHTDAHQQIVLLQPS